MPWDRIQKSHILQYVNIADGQQCISLWIIPTQLIWTFHEYTPMPQDKTIRHPWYWFQGHFPAFPYKYLTILHRSRSGGECLFILCLIQLFHQCLVFLCEKLDFGIFSGANFWKFLGEYGYLKMQRWFHFIKFRCGKKFAIHCRQ